jgi:hypothetical protein
MYSNMLAETWLSFNFLMELDKGSINVQAVVGLVGQQVLEPQVSGFRLTE